MSPFPASRIEPDELGILAETEAQSVLLDRLAVARPDDVVFGEWCPDSPERLGARRVWFLDPPRRGALVLHPGSP